MARLPDFVLPAHSCMVIRCNKRAPVFVTHEDYRYFLEKIAAADKNVKAVLV